MRVFAVEERETKNKQFGERFDKMYINSSNEHGAGH
jgi:hypothetical protein